MRTSFLNPRKNLILCNSVLLCLCVSFFHIGVRFKV